MSAALKGNPIAGGYRSVSEAGRNSTDADSLPIKRQIDSKKAEATIKVGQNQVPHIHRNDYSKTLI